MIEQKHQTKEPTMKTFVSLLTLAAVSALTPAAAPAQQPDDNAWADAQQRVTGLASLAAAKDADAAAEEQLAHAHA